MILFITTGIGNGSTFRSIPYIFSKEQAGPVLGLKDPRLFRCINVAACLADDIVTILTGPILKAFVDELEAAVQILKANEFRNIVG